MWCLQVKYATGIHTVLGWSKIPPWLHNTEKKESHVVQSEGKVMAPVRKYIKILVYCQYHICGY